MAHGAELIDVPGGAAPVEYQLAGSEALMPEAISAFFDGSGAASEFRPCLELYAQSGELLSRTFPSETFAAGDSGEVTFAPFVRPTGAAGDPFLVRAALYTAGALTIPSGAATDIAWGVSSLGPSGLEDLYWRTTTAGGRIHLFTETLIPYILSLTVEWEAFAGTRYIEMAQAAAHPPTMRLYGGATPDDDVQVLTALITPQNFDVEITFKAFQNSGVNRTVTPYFNAYVGAGGLF